MKRPARDSKLTSSSSANCYATLGFNVRYASFWREGYPAIMITDTAPFRNPAYHTGADTPEQVDCASMARVVRGVESVVRMLAGPVDD